jgi:hypothetical protein
MSRLRRVLMAAAVFGGVLLAQGGAAHASAQPYALEAQLTCGSVLEVSAGPQVEAIQHQITITGTYVTHWGEYDETGYQLLKHPIHVDGLEVGSVLWMVDGDMAQGISYDLEQSPLVGAEGLTFWITATRTYSFKSWSGQLVETLDEYSAVPITYADDCPVVRPRNAPAQVPQEFPAGPGLQQPAVEQPATQPAVEQPATQPAVEQPAVEQPPAAQPAAAQPAAEQPAVEQPPAQPAAQQPAVQQPAVSATDSTTSTTSTVPAAAVRAAPEQINPGVVAAANHFVALSPQAPARQTLPATGSDLTLLAGAVAALTLGLGMVAATRRR